MVQVTCQETWSFFVNTAIELKISAKSKSKKFALEQVMKAQKRSRIKALLFL